MVKSYILIGWRNILRSKGYSMINIGGLAIGMTIVMFIGLWIHDELSFNRYHQNYDHIAQLWNGSTDPATSKTGATPAMQYPVAAVLKHNYSQYFKRVVNAWWINNYPIAYGENKFNRIGQFIEPEGLELLSIKMVKGSYKSLDDPHSIILSKSSAASIFGNEDPMNKTIRISNEMDARVTGIYEDLPQNSTFGKVEFFAPWSLWVLSHRWIKNAETDWDNRQFCAYVEIQPNLTFEQVTHLIRDLYKDHVPADFYATFKKYKPYPLLVPMSTWHLYSEFKNGRPAGGRITFVWLFGLIGVFVLLLASINFINLSTARAERRAKEVGIRKTIGSGRNQLVFQFLIESLLVVFFSFILSIILLILFQRPFNQLSDKDIPMPFSNVYFWMISAGLVVCTAFAAGMYPSFYLSSFQPIKVLKGILRGNLTALPRKVMVIVQFTISVTLIIGTIVVYEQVRFARNRPVGYNQNGLITINMNDPSIRKNMSILKTELLNSGAIQAVALSSSPLTGIYNFTNGYQWSGKDPALDGEFAMCMVTPDYGLAIDWNIIDGRDFSATMATDTQSAILVNRSAIKYMGLKDPIGKQLTKLNEFGAFIWSKTIIGVVDDVVMSSPYQPVQPTIYYYRPEMFSYMQLRINAISSAEEALSKIKSIFGRVVPTTLLEYSFVEEIYGKKFSEEQRIGKIAGIFAIVTVVISCLGLFGLASFVAVQRRKEIGIRKVLGASVTGLWKMLSKEFAGLVFISCLVSFPLGYYFMNTWLQKFEYRTTISIWVFVLTCISAIVITLLSVSYQSLRAATSNPMSSLRSE